MSHPRQPLMSRPSRLIRSATRLLWSRGIPVAAVAGVLLAGAVSPALAVAIAPDAYIPSRMAVAAPAGATTLCVDLPWACSHSGTSAALTSRQVETAKAINRKINRSVTAVADEAQYRLPEVWALPTRQGGDCEDFALLKKQHLIAAGIAPEHLLIATVLDRRRDSHAVLVLRTSQGDYVLDNLTDDFLHWEQTGYTFLRMQNPDAPEGWIAALGGGILASR